MAAENRPGAAWRGVFPAATTQMTEGGALDLPGTVRHARALLDAGCHGIVMLGTLGEGSSLDAGEKREVLRTTVEAVGDRAPVLAGVAETTTAGAARAAEAAAGCGVDGLMVLPGLLYKADRRETLAHFRTVARATELPVMVYNNPVSYGVDVSPDMFLELADEPTLVAIKESSDDVRRITDLRNEVAHRYQLFCGVDDLALEAIVMGADGWVAGLVDAFPRETVAIWDLATSGRVEEAREIYRWFAPLLHLDTHPKLVQFIKLCMAEEGLGSEHVRPPRLPLEGEDRRRVAALVAERVAKRPRLPGEPSPSEAG